MQIIIATLLFLSAVHAEHRVKFIHQKQPTLQPAAPRIDSIDRSSYTIQHGDAKSSVNVNFHSAGSDVTQEYNQAHSSGQHDVQGDAPQTGVGYYQGGQGGQYLIDLATKQYLNINPNNIDAQPDQSYNVGYSINIANTNSPKLTYRAPMPKHEPSYRQQKLLNSDIITGTNKGTVEKPLYNHISQDYSKGQYYAPKTTITKVYGDTHNTHGYTWKSLSPGVEISGYHTLDEMPQNQANKFDHAAALGRSQGFDISNVVQKGYTPHNTQNEYAPSEKGYLPLTTTKEYSPQITKKTSEKYVPQTQALSISKDYSGGNSGSTGHGNDDSVVDMKFDQQNNYPSHSYNYEPSSHFKSSGISFGNEYSHDLLAGSRIEYDKSLLEGFYKNYNPSFYSPEITLPSPSIPKGSIHLNLHHSASHQMPQYQPISYNPPNPQMNMINQHYAFVQASSTDSSQGQDQLQSHLQEQLQDQGGQYQSQGGESQGHGGQFNEGQFQGGQFQNHGGQFESQGGQSQGGQFQSHGSQFEGQVGQSQGEQFQSHGNQFEGAGGHLQNQLSQLPGHLEPLSGDVKPVTEQQEDSQVQQSQKVLQQAWSTPPSTSNNSNEQNVRNANNYAQQSQKLPKPNFSTISLTNNEHKGKSTEHKKYLPQSGHHHHMPFRQYARPVVYDKNHRLQSLRSRPMIIVHQKY